jgi:hypothetical protein
MFDKIANAESNVELKTNTMNFILREICSKYKQDKNAIFTLDEIHKWLQGFGKQYLDLNVRDLLRGSEYIEIDDNHNLLLNNDGKKFCDDESSKL